jgi:chloride channel 7
MQECPEDAPTCPRPENSHSGNFVGFGCKGNNEYNDLATLFFNTQDDAIRNLYSAGTPHEYSMWSLFLFFIAFYCLTIITYGIAVPAGAPVPCVQPCIQL